MCFDELVDCEVMVDGVKGDDSCSIFFWRIVDFFRRMGVRGPCLEIFDFFMGVPRPFPAFDDLLFLSPTEEALFVVFGTGGRCSLKMGVRRPAFVFVDFPFFAGAPFAFCFEFWTVPAVDVFDRTDFFFFFFPTLSGSDVFTRTDFFFFFSPTLPGSVVVVIVCLVAFMFELTAVSMNGMHRELAAETRDFRGHTRLFGRLPPL